MVDFNVSFYHFNYWYSFVIILVWIRNLREFLRYCSFMPIIWGKNCVLCCFCFVRNCVNFGKISQNTWTIILFFPIYVVRYKVVSSLSIIILETYCAFPYWTSTSSYQSITYVPIKKETFPYLFEMFLFPSSFIFKVKVSFVNDFISFWKLRVIFYLLRYHYQKTLKHSGS